ncbi:MAG: hypothetical protein JOZ69_22140, partial [Myxococcales bacterium]|nr:hypothetical protein [Myxococcales bacterium]
FYFPVGLATSRDGDLHDATAPMVLYVANSDFDLQFSGGTLQSYDLKKLRRDAAHLVTANVTGQGPPIPAIPRIDGKLWEPGCMDQPPTGGALLGQSCAPPVMLDNPKRNSDPTLDTHYKLSEVVTAAFATDLQFSALIDAKWAANRYQGFRRLLAPVRGVAALTWVDVDANGTGTFHCGQGRDHRCDGAHNAGNDPNQSSANTRQATMPGEPFGMAQTHDGTAIVITHQTDTKTSLLRGDGTPDYFPPPPDFSSPTMEFVLDGLPLGGIGVAEVPHDRAASVPACDRGGAPPANATSCVRPAFLETNRTSSEVDLLRYYDDDGTPDPDGGVRSPGSSMARPFLTRESAFGINSNAVGTDSRGIAIDNTPRTACKVMADDPSLPAEGKADRERTCGELAARVFFASRTPPALGIGEIGGPALADTRVYNPDRFVLMGNQPLPPGPSQVYLAPVVNRQGNLELRVFVVLFDSNEIAVYDPNEQRVDFIDVGPGPFGMAFDPFDLDEVARGPTPSNPAPTAGQPDADGNRLYRFAYVASFTESFVQMIDLDNSQPTASTYERVVYTLGQPTLPKGQ